MILLNNYLNIIIKHLFKENFIIKYKTKNKKKTILKKSGVYRLEEWACMLRLKFKSPSMLGSGRLILYAWFFFFLKKNNQMTCCQPFIYLKWRFYLFKMAMFA
jgi:hypothetical protein